MMLGASRILSAKSLRDRASALYVLFATPSLLLLLLVFPNYHAPDDADHFKRAYTLLDRPFDIVTPPGRMSGAMIDTGLLRYSDEQFELAVRPDRENPSLHGRNSEEEVPWLHRQSFSQMPGAMAYLPLLYIPQAVAISIGRSLDLTVQETIYLARLFNGVTALALTWLGLLLLPQGHALVLTLLALPRTLLQFASNSPDPLLLAGTILIVAIALRKDLHKIVAAVAMSVALFASAALRPPIAALALIPAGVGLANRSKSWIIMPLLAVVSAAGWTLWAISQIVDTRCTGEVLPLAGRASAFVANLGPLLIGSFSEHGHFYFMSFIAHYGYGEAPSGYIASPLPWPVYTFAILLFAWAARIDFGEGQGVPRLTRLLLAAAAVGMFLITFFAMFVACTGPGSNVIAGVQGRYFIPAVITLAPAIAGWLSSNHRWSWQPFALILVLAVAASLLLMVHATPALYRL